MQREEGDLDDVDEEQPEPEGTSPVRAFLLFFGIPLLMLVVGAAILMTPCS